MTFSDRNKRFNRRERVPTGTFSNPYEDTLTIECEIDRDDGSSYFDYFPTDAETQLMKDLITAKIQEEYHQTPKEFCESTFDDSIEIGGI